jgi:hypothetical protein
MALTYTQLTALVRNWANRNVDVVSDSIIQDSLKYAADKAYRTLRIPPLENVATYSKTELEAATMKTTSGLTKTEIRLPADLVEFIQIKELDESGATVRVFNEKLDIRTFNDVNAEKYSNMNYWARQRNMVFLTPGFNSFGTANSIELLYYRRLPALDAKYAVTVLNYAASYLKSLAIPTSLPLLENQDYLHFTTAKNSVGMNYVTAKINGAVNNSVLITNDSQVGTIVAGQELLGVGVTTNPTTGKPPIVVRIIDQNNVEVDTAQTLLVDNADIVFAAVNRTTAYGTQAEAITAAASLTPTNATGKTDGVINGSTTITNSAPDRVGTIVVGQELSGAGVVNNPITGAPPIVTNATTPNSIVVDTAQILADNVNITFSNTNSTLFIGNEIPNWLRDQNERVILMGALAEVFSFTQEDDQAQKYLALFMSEIKELNDEDATRNASGGNLQVNFNGRGLI